MARRKKRVKRLRIVIPSSRRTDKQPDQATVANGSPAPTPQSRFTAEYLLRLKARDPETQEHFGNFFTERLRFKVRMSGLPGCDQEDVINETLELALVAVDNGQPRSPEKFGAYVSGICDNVLRKMHESKKRQYVSVDEVSLFDPKESAEAAVLRQEVIRRVKKVLGRMRRKDRNLLRMKIFEELSSQEMMARCGARTPENLRVRLHRALQAFAKECKKAGLDSR